MNIEIGWTKQDGRSIFITDRAAVRRYLLTKTEGGCSAPKGCPVFRPMVIIYWIMKNWMNEVLLHLKELVSLLKELKTLYTDSTVHKSGKLLNKQDVISLLNISDTTYRRYVKMGRLRPMKLRGIDMYREEDLLLELQESRRKGRV